MFKNFRAEKNRLKSKMVHNTITESYQTRLPGLTTDLPNQNSFEVEGVRGGGRQPGKLYLKHETKIKTKPP